MNFKWISMNEQITLFSKMKNNNKLNTMIMK